MHANNRIPAASARRPALAALLAAVALLSLAVFSCAKEEEKLLPGLYARFHTARGDIVVQLFYREAPLACANFVGLAEGTLQATLGKPFYDGLAFDKLEEGVLIQGGDPAGDGSGTPGYTFPSEFHPNLRHDSPGILSMANAGMDANGCQFFFTLKALPALDDRYAAFGRVVSGLNVVQSLRAKDAIKSVTIIRVGDEAQAFRGDQETWDKAFAYAAVGARQRALKDRETVVAALRQRWPALQPVGDKGILEAVIAEGSGTPIRRSALVKVRYKGMLPDGRIFDQSQVGVEPVAFEVGTGEVIAGWDMVLTTMRQGDKRLVAIPPELAYGAKGIPGVIPPNSYLVFEIAIDSVEL